MACLLIIITLRFTCGEKKFWYSIKNSQNMISIIVASNEFLDTFTSLYDDCFPMVEIQVKSRNPFRPWIIKGIAKSSKKKQKLYQKYLKNRNPQNLATHKTYKDLSETIKRKSKKNYYSEKILSFKGDVKKTWKTMKDLIGKAKMNKSSLLQRANLLLVTSY